MKKYTLTIGIPAYNEEKNIEKMLNSLLSQCEVTFKVEEVVVALDKCNDKTAAIVRRMAKKEKRINIILGHKRLGKSARLNQIIKRNKSDYLGFFDADILLSKKDDLELMVKAISSGSSINVVSGAQQPSRTSTVWGGMARASFYMLNDAAISFREGNNIHGLQGSASIVSKKFLKGFQFPKGTICDQGYLYAKATKKTRKGFKFVKKTSILFGSVDSYKDWRILGKRTLYSDKENMIKLLGADAINYYKFPRFLIIKAIFKNLLKNPIFTSGAIIMNLLIRLFPNNAKKTKKHTGMWQIVKSSKVVLKYE